MLMSALIALVIFGVALYLLQLIPMDPTVKRVIQVVAIAILVIWALRTLLPIAGLSG